MKSYSAQGVWWGLGIWRRAQRTETEYRECRLRGEQEKGSCFHTCVSVWVWLHQYLCCLCQCFLRLFFSHQADWQHSTSMLVKRIERKKEECMTTKLCMAIP